jgi:hypothetical protein
MSHQALNYVEGAVWVSRILNPNNNQSGAETGVKAPHASPSPPEVTG